MPDAAAYVATGRLGLKCWLRFAQTFRSSLGGPPLPFAKTRTAAAFRSAPILPFPGSAEGGDTSVFDFPSGTARQ